MPGEITESWSKFEHLLTVIWSMKPVWYLNLNFDTGENHEELLTLSKTNGTTTKNQNQKVE
jgi:hypothetical protein